MVFLRSVSSKSKMLRHVHGACSSVSDIGARVRFGQSANVPGTTGQRSLVPSPLHHWHIVTNHLQSSSTVALATSRPLVNTIQFSGNCESVHLSPPADRVFVLRRRHQKCHNGVTLYDKVIIIGVPDRLQF